MQDRGAASDAHSPTRTSAGSASRTIAGRTVREKHQRNLKNRRRHRESLVKRHLQQRDNCTCTARCSHVALHEIHAHRELGAVHRTLSSVSPVHCQCGEEIRLSNHRCTSNTTGALNHTGTIVKVHAAPITIVVHKPTDQWLAASCPRYSGRRSLVSRWQNQGPATPGHHWTRSTGTAHTHAQPDTLQEQRPYSAFQKLTALLGRPSPFKHMHPYSAVHVSGLFKHNVLTRQRVLGTHPWLFSSRVL